jgi:hypothetical protein
MVESAVETIVWSRAARNIDSEILRGFVGRSVSRTEIAAFFVPHGSEGARSRCTYAKRTTGRLFLGMTAKSSDRQRLTLFALMLSIPRFRKEAEEVTRHTVNMFDFRVNGVRIVSNGGILTRQADWRIVCSARV